MRCLLSLTVLLLLAGHACGGDPPGVVRSAKSGPWSAAATWEGGTVPGAGARVLIRGGHTVVYDVKSEHVIRAINVAGVLRFDPDHDTRLDVGLISVRPGEQYTEEGFDCTRHIDTPPRSGPMPALLVGTPERPISRSH